MKLAEPGPASACLRGRPESPLKQVSCDKWFARKLTQRAPFGTRRLAMRELAHAASSRDREEPPLAQSY
jgi:hypothetical protein